MPLYQKSLNTISSKAVAIIISTALVFIFLQSEVGISGFSEFNHGNYDYCKIVKTATAKTSKDSKSHTFKIGVNKVICFHCIYKTAQTKLLLINPDPKSFSTIKESPGIYLQNRSLLI
jgi:hypothetical protein